MYNQAVPDASLVACPECDLLQRLPEIEPGMSARCPRCDVELRRQKDHLQHRLLPLALAAAFLYVLANNSPMLGLAAVGREATTTVFGGAQQLWRDGQQLVAGLVFLTAVIAPGLQIGFALLFAFVIHRESLPPWMRVVLRIHPTAGVWSMIEVMMLGVLVALVKIAELATVVPGVAMYALGVLVFLLAGINASFDPDKLWDRVQWAETAEQRRSAVSRTAEASP
jgi:paraquat-inducible protein A